ncbi:endonuclease NucS domain-containing protein [Planktothrix sp. FACHB-1365]|uniref:endonuclease NucS domain-containing protein n=1 Tax=Planktothrix sp. FACHB-1365 TaxID=2692855 RepID=UPI001684345B|nr:endonuclease NucS domain-containing protein [Planktothrix sp. FACHB-1365]MBD2481916.1 DUF91 domain-containing protein [Planktothrix sp. FACHB-1365]
MLRQSRGKFLLKSEALLEEFVWLHLKPLLNLDPVKRQYCINKQNRSDILGANSEGRLAILELKKGGGKASIDQLLRYAEFLRQEYPQGGYFEQIDFSQKFLLIAIAAQFNSSTIDYAKRVIPDCLLLTYEVKQYNNEYYLVLKNIDNRILSKVEIEIIEDSLFERLPSFIQGYLLDKPEIRERVLAITQKILSYSPDISLHTQYNYSSKEMSFAKFNKKGELLADKTCVSFMYDPEAKKLQDKLSLYVYLPTLFPRKYKNVKVVTTIRIYTEDYINVDKFEDLYTFCYKDNPSYLNYPLITTGINKVYKSFQDYYINYRKYMKSRQKLRPIDASDFASVDSIIQIALEDWSVR